MLILGFLVVIVKPPVGCGVIRLGASVGESVGLTVGSGGVSYQKNAERTPDKNNENGARERAQRS